MVKKNQNGFSFIEALLVIMALAAIVFVGVFIASRKDNTAGTKQGTVLPGEVSWNFNQKTNMWEASGNPPTCPDPFFVESPVDTRLMTLPLYPGQYRGGNYKPHGGFSFGNSKQTDIRVSMPADATLTGLVRYIENDNLQYLLTFETSCGIAFRFDHLATLAPAFQAIAETTPEPKVNDTTASPLSKTVNFKTGDLVATAIGMPGMHGVGMDFGVYDYRHRNKISENSTWRDIHDTFTATEWYGVCWFDMLPKEDATRINTLKDNKGIDRPTNIKSISDYCPSPADGTTLDYNGGLPTNN